MGFLATGLGTAAAQARPVIDWEEPRCLLCNSDRASLLIEAPDTLPGSDGLWFAVAQCQDCGLCYTSPRPGDRAIGRFYPVSATPHDRAPAPRARRWWRISMRGRARHELHNLAPYGRSRLLDVGCGSGSFLARMRQRGWNVTGLDTSTATVQHLRGELGLSALVGSLPHPELADCSFDVITMRHSLEHVHRPLDVLRAAHRLLAVGGRLVVSASNIDSLPFKWFGRHWRGLDLPRHLTHFTPDTLQLMLARAGFEVGPVRMARHTDGVRCSAEQAARQPDTPAWQRWLRRRLAASLAVWYAYLVGRSDGMVVTAVKASPLPPLEPVPAFTEKAPPAPPSPADRWRNR
jgi:SAM-dependent methyltransferase